MTTHTAAQRVWLITGCSTGLGRALAEAVVQHGDLLVATARDPRTLAALVAQAPERVLAVALDVTDGAQVKAAIEAAIARWGRVDVLVNNAGFGMVGAVEEVSEAEARRVFDTNFFGLLAVTRAVLPHMRERRQGHILNISSLNGIVANGGTGMYAASKFAVEGLSETLAEEVASFGIRVTLVEPGPFRTDAAGRSLQVSASMDDYATTSAGQWRARVAQASGQQSGDPARAAAAMLAVVADPQPPLHLPLGNLAVDRIRAKLAAVAQDLDTWETVARNADFPLHEEPIVEQAAMR